MIDAYLLYILQFYWISLFPWVETLTGIMTAIKLRTAQKTIKIRLVILCEGFSVHYTGTKHNWNIRHARYKNSLLLLLLSVMEETKPNTCVWTLKQMRALILIFNMRSFTTNFPINMF